MTDALYTGQLAPGGCKLPMEQAQHGVRAGL